LRDLHIGGNIIKIDFKVPQSDKIQMNQNRDHWWALVNNVMNLWIPYNDSKLTPYILVQREIKD
jgi:hypothetical protein